MSSRLTVSRTMVWERSAAQYDRFEKRWNYYSRVSRGLVKHLDIGPYSRILELASGTGACTLLLSGRCGNGRVTCVEQSPAMIKIAKKNIIKAGRNNVVFLEGDVTDIQKILRNGYRPDFVVCNSALWQFPQQLELLKNVRRLLSAKGVFAFNLPIWYVSKQRASARRLITRILRKYRIDPRGFRIAEKPTNYRALLRKSGFRSVTDSTYTVVMRRKEWEEWRRIPAFARRWGDFRTLPEKARLEIQKETRKIRLQPWPENKRLKSKWQLFLASSTQRSRASLTSS